MESLVTAGSLVGLAAPRFGGEREVIEVQSGLAGCAVRLEQQFDAAGVRVVEDRAVGRD